MRPNSPRLLQFLSDWLASDAGHLGVSLVRFLGSRSYAIEQPRIDPRRFTFLPGGHAGVLFQTGEAQ
jgi:hypothetical protein